MYSVKTNRKTGIYIISTALLRLFVLGFTAWGAETPKTANPADAPVHKVEARETSKNALIVTAPNGPEASGQTSDPTSPMHSKESHTVSSLSAPGEESFSASLGPYYANMKPSVPVIQDNSPKKDMSLGMFVTTGYCTCELCSGGFGLTYSGTVPKASHTISADISRFPIGTRLMIGNITYTVEDVGSNVVGDHIDIFYDNHEDAMAHGQQILEVFSVK